MGRHPSIRPRVMSYLIANADKPLTAEAIQAATGLTLEQVQGQMRNLIKEGKPVQIITRAQIWAYKPNTEPEPEPVSNPDERDVTNIVYEGIGRTSAGAIIVRDVDTRTLYVLRELDI